MKIHPRPLWSEEFSSVFPEEHRKALQHVTTCARGRDFYSDLAVHQRRCLPEKLAEVLPWPDRMTADYSRSIEAAENQFYLRARLLATERAVAPERMAELMKEPPQRREMLIRNHPRFQTWGLLERVLEGARERGFKNPLEAGDLARLALHLADALDVDFYGAERIQDLRARAWGCLGNACRLQFDLHGADEAFEVAFSLLREGTGDVLELALLWDLKASLFRDQRRFEAAERLLLRAFRIYRRIGETHRMGRALVSLSLVCEQSGSPERSIPLLYEALELIDAEREPRVLWSAHHNLITTLVELGRFMEAQGLFIQARRLYDRFLDGHTQNRRHWIEGRIARGLGQMNKAETHLQSAQIGFIAEGASYDTALVSLELASLFAEQGRTRELKQIAEEMLTIFASQNIHREALAALSFLHQAAAAERASVEVVARVASHFKRLRYNPELAFEQPA